MACNACYEKVEKCVSEKFRTYGKFVARHPWKVIIFVVLLNGVLSLGMLRLNSVNNVEKLYTPMRSQAHKDTDKIKAIFNDLSGSNYRSYQMADVGKYAQLLVRPVGGDIMDTDFLSSLYDFYTFLIDISTKDDNGNAIKFTDICAMRDGVCAVDGDLFVDSEFMMAVAAQSVDYPVFTHTSRGKIYYEQDVSGATVVSGKLQSATMVSLTLHLRTDNIYYVSTAEKWQEAFLSSIEVYSNANFSFAYSSADSLSEELDKNVAGDIGLFSVTFTLMITYACIATFTARCDVVGQKGFLGIAGVLPAVLAIAASFGLCSELGVDFVSIVGVVPFLIIGIGVDDMFLLMSGMTETDYKKSIEERIGETMATSGISITITSLTDILAFAAGASSTFLSVRNFCLYAGAAVMFCYINQSSIFLACIAINEQRTQNIRHFIMCRKVRKKKNDDKEYLENVKIVDEPNPNKQEEGEHLTFKTYSIYKEMRGADNKVYLRVDTDTEIIYLEPVTGRLKTKHNTPTFLTYTNEKIKQYRTYRIVDKKHIGVHTIYYFVDIDKKLIQLAPTIAREKENWQPSPKRSCSLSFCYYLCCTGRPPVKKKESRSLIDMGVVKLMPKLLSHSLAKFIIIVLFVGYLGVSIYGVTEMKQGLDLKNLVSEDSYAYKYHEWLEEFPEDTIVSFVFNSEMTYSDASTKTAIDNFIAQVKSDDRVRADFEINWFSTFDSTADKTSETTYIASLQTFLAVPSNSRFQNDVVIDTTRNVITASRIHLISKTLSDSQEQGQFMLSMRELAEDNSLSVFAFSPAFLYFEQYVAILPQTLQTVGIAVAAVFFVTCILMPHPLLLIYIVIIVVMITVDIFGILHFLSLTLNSITMIHLIMSIGFSVDFTAHICHGYMILKGENNSPSQNDRMKDGVTRSGAPIFHGAMSSLIGVVVLVAAESFIFKSFFYVMASVIIIGILHALFLLPVILSLIGPVPSVSSSPRPERKHSQDSGQYTEDTV